MTFWERVKKFFSEEYPRDENAEQATAIALTPLPAGQMYMLAALSQKQQLEKGNENEDQNGVCK